jgi:hypothetical protein
MVNKCKSKMRFQKKLPTYPICPLIPQKSKRDKWASGISGQLFEMKIVNECKEIDECK